MTIATMRASLTQDDIRRLVKGENPDQRALATKKICEQISQRELSENERLYAAKILDHLANDAAELVRKSLAVTLQNSPNLPHDLALRLARDVDAVAAPVLTNSPVLSDV